ncbi:MAG: hypothetical protein N7Q72_02205, partial [Spiroplasma sp. Tabriz.8]|nr:hypothetical protein [Spiroplasma sp. Tabriz.8]
FFGFSLIQFQVKWVHSLSLFYTLSYSFPLWKPMVLYIYIYIYIYIFYQTIIGRLGFVPWFFMRRNQAFTKAVTVLCLD